MAPVGPPGPSVVVEVVVLVVVDVVVLVVVVLVVPVVVVLVVDVGAPVVVGGGTQTPSTHVYVGAGQSAGAPQ